MKPLNDVAGKEDSMIPEMEVPVYPPTVLQTTHVESETSCTHSRLIVDVLMKNGKRTGKVRCCECRTIFDDPYQGLK